MDVALGVILEDNDTVDVVEGEAPMVREAVGEVVMVELKERVVLGVGEGVEVGEGVDAPEGVDVPLLLAVTLGVRETVEVVEGLAPRLRLGVALPVSVEEEVRVVVGVI